MRRRDILVCAAVSALPAGAALAQAPPRPARIAMPLAMPYASWPRRAAFIEAMRERGWIEGTHFVVDVVQADASAERMPATAAELVQRRPDLIVTSSSATVGAIMKATSTIPIVFYAVGDPVGSGFVASFARPGGNVTGIGGLAAGAYAKQLELLTEAVPGARRIGVPMNPQFPLHEEAWRELEPAAQRRGLQLRRVSLRSIEELDGAFTALAAERIEALHLFGQVFLALHAARVAAQVAQHRWPAVSGFEQLTQAGLLLSYTSRLEDDVRRVAYYVDRILKGTPPGELPVEQPTRFYTTINLKTARALGLTLPHSLLLRADEVIE
jgi:putative ABC transport system substrate-binding protein